MWLCKFEKCTPLQAFVPQGVGSNWSSRRYLTAHILPKFGTDCENRCVFISGRYDINVGLLVSGLLETGYFHLWHVVPISVRGFQTWIFSPPAPSRLLTCGTDSRTLKSGGLSILICHTDYRTLKGGGFSVPKCDTDSRTLKGGGVAILKCGTDFQNWWVFHCGTWCRFSDFER